MRLKSSKYNGHGHHESRSAPQTMHFQEREREGENIYNDDDNVVLETYDPTSKGRKGLETPLIHDPLVRCTCKHDKSYVAAEKSCMMNAT